MQDKEYRTPTRADNEKLRAAVAVDAAATARVAATDATRELAEVQTRLDNLKGQETRLKERIERLQQSLAQAQA